MKVKRTNYNFTLIFFFLLLFINTGFVYTQVGISDNIVSAIGKGDAESLAKYFNSNVELTILNKEDIYSKAQAKQIIKEFFLKNNPKTFTILHEGNSSGAKFTLGRLETLSGTYRIYLLMKFDNRSVYINQFKIKLDNRFTRN